MPITLDEKFMIFLTILEKKNISEKYDIFNDRKLGLFTNFILDFHQFIDQYQLNGNFLIHILVQKNYPIEYLYAVNLMGANMLLKNQFGLQASDIACYGSNVRNYLLSFEDHSEIIPNINFNIDILPEFINTSTNKLEKYMESYSLEHTKPLDHLPFYSCFDIFPSI